MPRTARLDPAALLALIDSVYAAAGDVQRWEAFLLRLSDVLAASGAILLHHDLANNGAVVISGRIDPTALRLYNEHYHRIDPWALSPRAKSLVVQGRPVPDEALVERSTLRRTQYYADFVSYYELTRLLTTKLSADNKPFCGISVFRGESSAAFDTEDERYMETLAPHLVRALQIHQHVRTADTQRDAAVEGLEALGCAVFLVTRHARVVHANRAGRELLTRGCGLSTEASVLCADRPSDTKHLRALCAKVACTQDRLPCHPGGALTLERSSALLPLQVLVARAGTSDPLAYPDDQIAALVFVNDPMTATDPDETLLRVFYRLTDAEARVAANIGHGQTLAEIAQTLGYTTQTMQWYNKQVLSKTGCRNRAELVRQMSSTLASLLPDRSF